MKCPPTLARSTTPGWEECKVLGALQKPLDARRRKLKKNVEELTAGSENEMDRLKSVFY